jgi:hypothetical protein
MQKIRALLTVTPRLGAGLLCAGYIFLSCLALLSLIESANYQDPYEGFYGFDDSPPSVWETGRGPYIVAFWLVVLLSATGAAFGSRLSRAVLMGVLVLRACIAIRDDIWGAANTMTPLAERQDSFLWALGVWWQYAEWWLWLDWFAWLVFNIWYFFGSRTQHFYTKHA